METIRLLMSTDARRDEVLASMCVRYKSGFDKAEIRTVDVEWKSSRASAVLHNAHIHESRYSLTYPIGSIRPAEQFRYPPC